MALATMEDSRAWIKPSHSGTSGNQSSRSDLRVRRPPLESADERWWE